MKKVEPLELDKLTLLFEPPIGCLTKKEAKKERRLRYKQNLRDKERKRRWERWLHSK